MKKNYTKGFRKCLQVALLAIALFGGSFEKANAGGTYTAIPGMTSCGYASNISYTVTGYIGSGIIAGNYTTTTTLPNMQDIGFCGVNGATLTSPATGSPAVSGITYTFAAPPTLCGSYFVIDLTTVTGINIASPTVGLSMNNSYLSSGNTTISSVSVGGTGNAVITLTGSTTWSYVIGTGGSPGGTIGAVRNPVVSLPTKIVITLGGSVSAAGWQTNASYSNTSGANTQYYATPTGAFTVNIYGEVDFSLMKDYFPMTYNTYGAPSCAGSPYGTCITGYSNTTWPTSSTYAGASYLFNQVHSISSSTSLTSPATSPTASGTESYLTYGTGILATFNPTFIHVAAPTATPTQPSCGGTTGTVALTGLPSGGTVYWTGTASSSAAYSGTSYTTPSLGVGSYTFYSSANSAVPPSCVTGTVTLASPVVPAALVLTGSNICASPGNNGTVTSSTSQGSVNYQLYNSSNTPIGGIQGGTGLGLTWSSLVPNGGYYVIGTYQGAGSCTKTSNTVAVTSQATPTATAGSAQTICGSGGTITGWSAGNYSDITWATTGSGSFSPTHGTTNPTYTPSTADITAGHVNITMTSVATSPCASNVSAGPVTITIQPVPTATAGSAQTICGSGGTITGFSAANYSDITWVTSGSGSFSPTHGTTNPIYTPSTADITAGSVTITMTSVATSPCGTNQSAGPVTITIQKVPTATAGSAQTICGSGGTITGFSAANYSDITWATSGSGSFSPTHGTTNPIYTPSTADITAGHVTVTMTSVATSPCGTNQSAGPVTITIQPVPTATPGSAQTICQTGGTITGFSASNYSDITWATTGSGSFSPTHGTTNPTYTPSGADITAGHVNITMTSVATSPCGTNQSAGPVTVTIQGSATATAGSAQTICGSGGTITGFSATNYSDITWATSGSGTFSPTHGTTNPIYTPSTADITAGHVTVTMTSVATSPCGTNQSAGPVTITIQPVPTATAGSAQTICQTGGTITGFSATNYSDITWTTTGSGSFSPTHGTTNPTYTPSGADITAGHVNITMTSVATSPCGTNQTTGAVTITIQGSATATAGSAQTICQTGGTITGFSATNYSDITWATTGSGSFSPTHGTTNPTYTPSGADITAGHVNITMTSVATSPCGTNQSAGPVTVTIQGSATATAGSAQTICGSGGTITGFSATNYSDITWATTGSGTFSPTHGTTNPIYTPSTADITAGHVTVTMTSVATSPCGTNQSAGPVTVTIQPVPTATAGSAQTICQTGGTITGFSATNYSDITWTTTGTGTFSPTHGTTNPIYTPSGADITAGHVNITMTSVATSPCGANQTTGAVTITIQGSATATAGSAQSICGSGGTIIGFSATNYSDITWTTTGTGTFSPTHGTTNPTYNPSGADITAGHVNITMTSVATSPCGANQTTGAVTITIQAVPTATAGSAQTICGTGATITGFSATNYSDITWTTTGTGTFSPTHGTTNPIYTPSTADITAGHVNITMTSVATSPCAANQTTGAVTITITAAATATPGPTQVMCPAGATLTGFSATNYSDITWTTTGTGIFAPTHGTVNPTYTPSGADITAGTVNITMTAVANAYCSNVTTAAVTVNIDPLVTSYGTITASVGTSQNLCPSINPFGTFAVTGASGGSGAFTYQWYTQAGLDPAPSGAIPGSWTIIPGATNASYVPIGTTSSVSYACVVTPALACAGTATWAAGVLNFNVSIPTAFISGGNDTVCTGGTVTLSATSPFSSTWQWYSAPAAGGPWTGPIGTASTYTPVTTSIGEIYYHAVATYVGSGCSPATSSPEYVVVVAQPTIVTQPGSISVCQGGSDYLNATFTGGAGATYQWITNYGTGYTNVANNDPNAPGITYNGAPGDADPLEVISSATSYTGTLPYKVVISFSASGCPGSLTSSPGSATINPQTVITTQPVATTSICPGITAYLGVVATPGFTLTYEWQYDNGGTWADVTNGLPAGFSYLNAFTPNLTINTTSLVSTAGSRDFRCLVHSTGTGCSDATSSTGTIVILSQPVSFVPLLSSNPVCITTTGGGANVLVFGSQSGVNYQLQTVTGPTNVGSPVSGTGGTIPLPTGSVGANTTFQVQATTTSSGCTYTSASTIPVVAVNPDVIVGTQVTGQHYTGVPGSFSRPANANSSPNSWGLSVTNEASSGDYQYYNASNVLTNANVGSYIQTPVSAANNLSVDLISPLINTIGYSNISVQWGARMSTTYTGSVALYYSINSGTSWTAVPYTEVQPNVANDPWNLVNNGVPIKLPADASNITTLKLKWTANGSTDTSSYGINDIGIYGLGTITNCGNTTVSVPFLYGSCSASKYNIGTSTEVGVGNIWPGLATLTNATLPSTPLSVTVPAATATGTYDIDFMVNDGAGHSSATISLPVTTNPSLTITPVLKNCSMNNTVTALGAFGYSDVVAIYANGGSGAYKFTSGAVIDTLLSVIDQSDVDYPGTSNHSGVKGVFLAKADGGSHTFTVTDATVGCATTGTIITQSGSPNTIPFGNATGVPAAATGTFGGGNGIWGAFNSAGQSDPAVPTTPVNYVNGPALGCLQTAEFGTNWVTYQVNSLTGLPASGGDTTNNSAVMEIMNNGQNLDSVSVSVYRDAVLPETPNAASQTTACFQFPTYAMERHFMVKSTKSTHSNAFGNPVGVRLYFTDAEFQDLKYWTMYAATHATGQSAGCALGDTTTSLYSLYVTKYTYLGSGTDNEDGDYNNNSASPTGLYRLFGHGTTLAGNGPLATPVDAAGATLTTGGATNLHYLQMNVAEFSEFWIAGSQGIEPLPINMIYFEAVAMNNTYVQVRWATMSEINCQSYDIERSTDANTWTTIGTVAGHGNSITEEDYTFNDNGVIPEVVYYYRLKQNDNNGNYTYTGIVQAMINASGTFIVSNFIPNPSTGKTQFLITTASAQDITVDFYDVIGQKVLSTTEQLTAGNNTIDFDLRRFAAGNYSVVVTAASQLYTKRLVLVK